MGSKDVGAGRDGPTPGQLKQSLGILGRELS
jgi:hypothetical protein